MGLGFLATGLSISPANLQAGESGTQQDDASVLGRGILLALKDGTEGNLELAAMNAASAGADYLFSGLGEEAPAWLLRTEFEWRLGEDERPEYSLLTVQPLYESDAKRDTIFTQFSQRRYNQHNQDRNVTNIGLGYRRLLNDNTILAGANAFFDYDWKYNHQRGGIGGEIKWSGMDFRANTYRSLSEKRTVGTDVFEEIMDGHDVEVSMQIPYLPWARLHGKKFWWDSKATNDVRGWRAALELDLHQNLQIEAGVTDDSSNNRRYLVQFRFKAAAPSSTVALSSNPVDSTLWRMRDMSEHTLDKVRRENRIITERTVSGTVSIGRGT